MALVLLKDIKGTRNAEQTRTVMGDDSLTQLTTQANTGNCTNVNVTDLLDDSSNNTSSTMERTKIEDSFNQAHHHHR